MHTGTTREQPVEALHHADPTREVCRSAGESTHVSGLRFVFLGQLGIDEQLHHEVRHGTCWTFSDTYAARSGEGLVAQADERRRTVEERVGSVMQVDARQELGIEQSSEWLVGELHQVGQHRAEHEGGARADALGNDCVTEVVHRTVRPRWFMTAPRSMQTQMLGAKARVPATVTQTVPLSPRVRAVTLRIPSELGTAYTWCAGQHVAVWLEEAEGESRPRYYSFAAMPSLRGTVELCVGESEDAPPFPEGGQVWLSPPAGHLAVPEPVETLALVGVGTGVAPLRAVVQEQTARRPGPQLTLLVGFRSEVEMLYADEFLELAAAGLLDYRPVLSQPSAAWSGRVGRVQAYVAELGRFERYCICGKLALVDDVRQLLVAAGVQDSQLFAEGY